ncbi:MAG: hypothetical protein IIA59_06045 [Candidatus Marinimicrobia bacterium]|nr:hypothetical protein [Candidatus Neomarinimicrobiota bacterium]
MKHEKRIDDHMRYFANKIEDITDLAKGNSANTSVHTFQKLLLVSLLDALSMTRFGNKMGNRERFIAFMEQFGNWGEGKRLSIPHLSIALVLDRSSDLKDLRDYVWGRWGSWKKGRIVFLDQDLELADFTSKIPQGVAATIDEQPIERYNHYNLLYKMRNALIHELRQLGYGMEFAEYEVPYYHSMSKIDDLEGEDATWELVYPLGFLVSLTKTAVGNFEKHLKETDSNPDEHFRFGTYYFNKMNPKSL